MSASPESRRRLEQVPEKKIQITPETKLGVVPKEAPDISEALELLQLTMIKQRERLFQEKAKIDAAALADPEQGRSENQGARLNEINLELLPRLEARIKQIGEAARAKDNAGWQEAKAKAEQLIAENKEWETAIISAKAKAENAEWDAAIRTAKARTEEDEWQAAIDRAKAGKE
jgi:hypothetical protein